KLHGFSLAPAAYRLPLGSVFQQLFSHRQDVVDGKAELLEQLACRGRLTVGVHADDTTVQTHVLVPVVRVGRFDGDPRANFQRQYGLAVFGVLLVEYAGTGHGHHADPAALLGELFPHLHGEPDFRTGGDQDQFRLAFTALEHITATGDGRLGFVIAQVARQVLAREDQGAGAVLALQRVLPGHRRLDGIGRT